MLVLLLQRFGDKLGEHAGSEAMFNRPTVVGTASNSFAYEQVVDDICTLNWTGLSKHDLINVAWVYYFFSIQFRENLEIARRLYPDDEKLLELDLGERDTSNLSPWPGVAAKGERLDHDEFMRRTLRLAEIAKDRRRALESIGQSYLTRVRGFDDRSRAESLASYEDGGLEKVFRAILTAGDWNAPLLEAFRHFLSEHVRFDSDSELGHGALCRHLKPTDRVLPLWSEFQQLLITAAPALAPVEGRHWREKALP
jgi:hypothetical protein